MATMDHDTPTIHKPPGRHSSSLSRSLAAILPRSKAAKAAVMERPEVIREHTASRLPAYRYVDVLHKHKLEHHHQPLLAPALLENQHQACTAESLQHQSPSNNMNIKFPNPQNKHIRNQSTASCTTRDRGKGLLSSRSPLSPTLTPTPTPTPALRSSRHSFPAETSSFTLENLTTAPITIAITTSNSNSKANPDSDPNPISTNPPPPVAQHPRPLPVLDVPATKQLQETRRALPATAATPTSRSSKNSNGFKQNNGPPLSMITQGYYDGHALEADSTTSWVAQQSISLTPETDQSPTSPAQQLSPSSLSVAEASQARPVIKPIRGFKPSSRKSVEMSSRRASRDPDETLRALEGFELTPSRRNSHLIQQPYHADQVEHVASDESDLFLRAAREEEKAAHHQTTNSNSNSPNRSDSRRSRLGQRSSLPPTSNVFNPSMPRRRGSDQESANGSRPIDEQESVAQALTYRPTTKDRPTAPEDMNRSRYLANNTRSNPTTPRKFQSRERSPESQVTTYGARRTIPDTTLPSRSSYRQSNLSHTTPRTYNSSPLVSRSTDMHETPETPRAAEGTESSVSTTAPSTVWDELEDLKSRIHRLELTGKLPATSGAAMSRASNDRPPTATTTVTTISSSPKRGRGNSTSQEDAGATDSRQNEAHPLLQAALAKSKPLLNPDIFRALEAATLDSLAIASMMGTSGQPGPISSSQSTIGGPAIVSDRQVRRKADSLCRSLTELCLALSESQPEPVASINAASSATTVRPASRDPSELRISTEGPAKQRQLVTTDLVRMKSSPRAVSRLDERRSSLLVTSTLSSPRYTGSEVGTPTQPTSGRRTSMFLRTRRAATEEPEDEEIRFRSPSRATTEVGRFRSSPREYTSQQPLPERPAAIQSSLPVRRHYTSTSLTNAVSPPMPPVSSLGGRRYLDRSTPERDTSSIVNRLAEDRTQRKSSISQGFLSRTGSLNRKTRQSTPAESPSAGQVDNYQ